MTNIRSEPWLEDALTKRQTFSDNPHCPVCHLIPPAGWLNDPNGFIEWRGEYHFSISTICPRPASTRLGRC